MPVCVGKVHRNTCYWVKKASERMSCWERVAALEQIRRCEFGNLCHITVRESI